MNILYIDDAIIVIDKPAGLSVLPDGWEKESQYLVKLLEEEYGKIYIVHRLDKSTSGVMIFARTAEAHRSLNIQFENHEARKIYRAMASGNPKWDEKVAKFPLRINVGHKHRTMVDEVMGKLCETRFRVLKRGQDCVLLEAELLTGRTHQIRVHAHALGHPLLGDVLYSGPETDIIARPALHAYSLTFTHPMTNERLTFTVPYPNDFETVIKKSNNDLSRYYKGILD